MRWLWRRSRPPGPDASDRKGLGRWGEAVAARELERRGYRIVDRNVRFSRGEIDLVARDGDVLVLVEVKTRWTSQFAGAKDAITVVKASRLRKLGAMYLRRAGMSADTDWRVDVVAIDIGDRGVASIEVIQTAVEG